MLALPQKAKSLLVRASHSLLVPLTVLGDRISLLNSSSWHCRYGRAERCVYSLNLSDCIYPPNLFQIELQFPMQDSAPIPTPAPSGARATKLHFLSDLSYSAGTSNRAFPSQLIKSLTGWCKASSVFLRFKNSYQLRFY